jgi:hypothetical protein
VAARHQLDAHDQLDFIDSQILERKKVIYRFLVQIETAKAYATKDDKEANDLAEVKIREATGTIKALLWELDSLLELKNELVAEQS